VSAGKPDISFPDHLMTAYIKIDIINQFNTFTFGIFSMLKTSGMASFTLGSTAARLHTVHPRCMLMELKAQE